MASHLAPAVIQYCVWLALPPVHLIARYPHRLQFQYRPHRLGLPMSDFPAQSFDTHQRHRNLADGV